MTLIDNPAALSRGSAHSDDKSRMLPKDLIASIQSGIVETMIISRSSPTGAWSVSAFGSALPEGVVNRIELNPEGSERLWADIDAAYGFIRKCGFNHPVLIKG